MFMLSAASIANLLSGLGLFALLSTPSLKLVYSSSAINVFAIACLAVSFLLRPAAHRITNAALTATFLWLAYSGVLLFAGLQDFGDITVVAEYLYLIAAVLLVITVTNLAVLKISAATIMAWGFALSVWQLGWGVPTSRELGQHYLTVSMPMGAAFSCAIVLFTLASKWSRRIGFLLLAIFYLAALSTLLGRAGIIFSVLSSTIVIILQLVMGKRTFGHKLRIFAVLGGVAGCVAIAAMFLLDWRQAGRFARIFTDIQSEPRWQLWAGAVEIVSASPIVGHGFGSSERLFYPYPYPHNIFLEIMAHGGIFLMGFFVAFIIFIGVRSLRAFGHEGTTKIEFGFAAIALFLFLQWNVSFSMSGASIPLGALAALVAVGDSRNRSLVQHGNESGTQRRSR